MGLAIGIAALGSLGTTVYRNSIAGELPADTPAEVADASRDTLTRALETTRDLPGSMADQIITPARDAFAPGLNVVAIVGAMLVTALTILALTMLRHVAPTGITEGDH